jgi:hypothetical protein
MTDTDFIIGKLVSMAQTQTMMANQITRLNNILTDISNPDIEWVNRQEAAKYLEVSSTTVSRYGKDKKVEMDGRGMFKYKSLVEYKHRN